MAVEAKNARSTDVVARYYRDLKSEFKKITWASKDEVFKTTGIVLTTIVLFTLLLWVYDTAFGSALKQILQLIK